MDLTLAARLRYGIIVLDSAGGLARGEDVREFGGRRSEDMRRFVDKGLEEVVIRMRGTVLCLVVALVAACAQVPEQSVALSIDVGRALEDLRQKNAALIGQLFSDRKKKVNDFVDTVYAPYVIQRNLTVEKDYEDTGQKISMLNLIAKLVDDGDQKGALATMNFVVERLTADIQSKRRELLTPVETQERQVKGAFDSAFGIVIQGNETTTGLLRSIRQVHSAQENILQDIGLRQDLRGEANSTFARASDTIGKIIGDARAVDAALGEITADSAECQDAEDKIQCKVDRMKTILETAVDSVREIAQ